MALSALTQDTITEAAQKCALLKQMYGELKLLQIMFDGPGNVKASASADLEGDLATLYSGLTIEELFAGTRVLIDTILPAIERNLPAIAILGSRN